MKSSSAISRNSGLAHWMMEVPREAAKAANGFGTEAVHDLRVALRRCRSMADGFRAIDPNKNWKKMRRQATDLFDSLGELRDCQVMMDWVGKMLEREDDPVAHQLLGHLREQEPELKRQVEGAIEGFDRKQWQNWTGLLPRRAARVPGGSETFQALALEKLNDARRLQARAVKTCGPAAFHRLRIGLKKFRYVVENFLPHHHENWKDGLKHVQDLLGEIHDLDVLKETLDHACADELPEARQRWQQKLENQRGIRIERYRESMTGKNSLWLVWRAALPCGQAARRASLTRLQAWSSFLNSDIQHGRRVARFAVQIHEGLSRTGVLNGPYKNDCELLRAAATVHEVGRAAGDRNHHKKTEKMVGQLDHLVGWTQQDVTTMARIARYHRGALPKSAELQDVPGTERRKIKLLAGILRLADALDAEHDGAVRRITIVKSEGFVIIRAQGLREGSGLAERIAGARHLLEITCGLPILVRPLRERGRLERGH